MPVRARYVAPTFQLKTPSGRDPAVVLLPDTRDSSSAAAEAQRLAKLGVGALVLAAPRRTPNTPRRFDDVVAQALAAADSLRRRADVDPTRIGFIGEGVGAHVGAVAIGRKPGLISASVLADIGGVVVASRSFAPERWLQRAAGIHLLFQRDKARRAMSAAEVKRLMYSAPPGTLMEQYKNLDVAAEASRDKWIRAQLLAG